MSKATPRRAWKWFAGLPGYEQRVLVVGAIGIITIAITTVLNSPPLALPSPGVIVIIGAQYLIAHTAVHVPTRKIRFAVTANEAGMWLALLTLPTWLAVLSIVGINAHRALLPKAEWPVRFTNATLGLFPISATIWVLSHWWFVPDRHSWTTLGVLMAWAVVYCTLDILAECLRYPHGSIKQLLKFMPVKTMLTVESFQMLFCWVGLIWAWLDPRMESWFTDALLACLLLSSVVTAYQDRRRLSDLSEATQQVAHWSTTDENVENLLKSLKSLTPRGVLVLIMTCPLGGDTYAKYIDASGRIQNIGIGDQDFDSVMRQLPEGTRRGNRETQFLFSEGDEFWNLGGRSGTYRIRYFSGGCLIQLEYPITFPLQLQLGVLGTSRRELERMVPVELTIRSLSEAWEHEERSVRATREMSELVDLLKVSSDGIGTVSEDRTITSWNQTMTYWTGISADEALGCDYTEILPVTATEPGEAGTRFRWEIPHDDTVRYLECALTRLPGATEGSPYASMLSCRDVSEHVLTDRKRNEHIAVVSHELASPTTSIIMHAELAQELLEEEQSVHDQVESIATSAAQLEVLVSDLSVTATVVTSGVEAVRILPRHAALGEVVYPNLDACGAGPSQINLEGNFDIEVMCDPMRARQIMLNLLTNAVKYSPDGAPITVTASRRGREARIDVIDSGIGVPEAEQEILFIRFFRGQRNTGQPGAGIGLSISQELAVAMGGRIEYADRQGHSGSVFTLVLPVPGDEETPVSTDTGAVFGELQASAQPST